jgi:superfamily II DNA or RNA helicase
MHTLKLRGYQAEALAAVDERLAAGELRTAVVLPTGMGKTVVFSHLIARQLDAGRRVVVLVHRDELAEQAASKVRSVSPDATVGIVKAERNELDAQVLICSVQTLARPARIEQIKDSLAASSWTSAITP